MPSPQRRITNTGTRWFTVHVPGDGVSRQESYLRVGGPDITTESHFLEELRALYRDAWSDEAVRAAFGQSAHDGIALYSEGDMVTYVGGKHDTRVLDEAFTVHVLDRTNEDEAATSAQTRKTYRSYLRLGRPNEDLEGALSAATPPDLLVTMILGLDRPVDDPSAVHCDLQTAEEDVLAGRASVCSAVREQLQERARRGDDQALDVIESLRTSTDPRATVAHGGSTAHGWALAALNAIHVQVVDDRVELARRGDTAARELLARRARASDSVVRKKLAELSSSKRTEDAEKQGGQTAPKLWAKALLKELGSDYDRRPRWSLGDGIVMFSDKAMSMTTPDAIKVTVGKDSRTVLGPSYSETYDVSQEELDAIRAGTISGMSGLTSKRLITAALTRKDWTGLSWRSTKFDLSKSLGFGAADNGSFTLGSSYGFWAGLKFGNSFGVAFDASTGISVSAPLSAKVELFGTGMETSWLSGKLNYKEKSSLKGRSVEIIVDPAAKACSVQFQLVSQIIRWGMGVVNGALVVYVAAFSILGATTGDADSNGEADVKWMIEIGEAVYLLAAALNALLAAATIVLGAIQILAEKAGKVAKVASPAQPPNIVLNEAGIKLQSGSSYVYIGPTGILMSGTQIAVGSPMTTYVPQVAPGSMSPVGLLEIASLAGELPAWGF